MKKRVLFVCVENSCRSQIAEAFAKRHGSGIIEAFSAGSRPSGQVNPRAIASMREIGYDLTTHASKPLSAVPQDGFDRVITMGCGDACPLVRAEHREDWEIPDPRQMGPEEFRSVRDRIEGKVKELIARVKTGRSGG